MVQAARRPFQTWSSESFSFLLSCFPFPFPFPFPAPVLPPSFPSACLHFILLPPRVRAIFRAGHTKVRGPGAQYMTRCPATLLFPRPMWLRGRGGAAHYGPESS